MGSVCSSPHSYQGPALVGGCTICNRWLPLVFSHCPLWLPVFQGPDQERGMCHFCSYSIGENLLHGQTCCCRGWHIYVASCWVAMCLTHSLCCRGRRREQTWGEGIRNHPEMRCSLNFFSWESFIKIFEDSSCLKDRDHHVYTV